MKHKLKLITLEERIVLDAAIAAVVAHPHNVVIGPEVNITHVPGSQGGTQILIDPANHNDLALVVSSGSPPADLVGSSFNQAENNIWISKNGGSTWSEVQLQIPSNENMTAQFDKYGDLFVAALLPDASGAAPVDIQLFTNLFTSPQVTDLGYIGSPDSVIGPSGADDFPVVAIGAIPSLGSNAEAIYVSDTPNLSNGSLLSPEVSGAIITGPGTVTAFSQPESTNIPVVASSYNSGEATLAIGPDGQVIVVAETSIEGPSLPSITSATDMLGIKEVSGVATMQSFGTPVGVANPFDSTYPVAANPEITAQEATTYTPFVAWDTNTNTHLDPNAGRIYVTYASPDPNNPTSYNVYLDYSTNNGASWSNPIIVNDNVASVKLESNIAIDPSTGDVFVGWYDTRNDQGNNGSGDTDGVANDDVEYFGAISTNGGQSFSPDFQISAGATNIGYSDIVDNQILGSDTSTGLGFYSSPAFLNGTVYAGFEDNSSQLANNPDQSTDIALSQILVPTTLTAVNSEYAIPLTGSKTLTVNSANGVLSNIADPNASDTIGGTLTASLVSNPLDGTVVLNKDGSFTYTPNANFVGVDSFTYMAKNGTSTSDATVTIDTQRPQLNLNSPSNITYTQGGNAVLLDHNPTVTGTDLNFAGGLLNVYVENSTANDLLTIGTGNHITTSGNSVYYNGIDIGTFNGGNGFQTLVYTAERELNVVFNSNATAQAVAAVVSEISYSDVATTPLPSASTRLVEFVLSDGNGAVAQAASATVQVIPYTGDNPTVIGPNTLNLPTPPTNGTYSYEINGITYYGTLHTLFPGIQISDPGLGPNSQLLMTVSDNNSTEDVFQLTPGVIWYNLNENIVSSSSETCPCIYKGTLAELNQFLQTETFVEANSGMSNESFTIAIWDTSLNGTSFTDGSMMRTEFTLNVNFAGNPNPALPAPSDPFPTSYLPPLVSENQLDDMGDGSIIYVNQNDTGSVHNGKSWSTAYLTLQAALTAAASSKSPDQIWVAKGNYSPGSSASATYTLPNDVAIYGGFNGTETQLSQRNISKNVTILNGNDVTNDIITANGVVAFLDGLTIEGASNPDGGGAAIVDNNSILGLEQMTVSNNVGGGNWGASALWADGGILYIDSSLFDNNTAPYVSAITVTNAYLNVITNSTFSNSMNAPDNSAVTDILNTASIYANDKFLNNTQDNIVPNSTGATFGGSALDAQGDGSLSILNSVFNGNSSQPIYNGHGGGAVLLVSDQNTTISNSSFNNNSSQTQGGAIGILFNDAAINPTLPGSGNAQINIINSTFTNNSSQFNWGGAIYGQDSSISINNDAFNGNTAESNGGAALFLSSNVLVNNSVFQNDSAGAGGALEIFKFNNIIINNSQFINNTGTFGSGAIDTSGSNYSILINDNQFTNNSSPDGSGGAIGIFNEGNVTLTNNTFTGNSTGDGGNAIYSLLSVVNITNNTFNDTAPGSDLLLDGIVNDQLEGYNSASQTLNPTAVINALTHANRHLLANEIALY